MLSASALAKHLRVLFHLQAPSPCGFTADALSLWGCLSALLGAASDAARRRTEHMGTCLLHTPEMCNTHRHCTRGSGVSSGSSQDTFPEAILCSAMLSSADAVSTALYAPQWFYKSLQEHLRTKKLLVFSLLPPPSSVTHNTFVQGFISKAFFNINLGRKSCSGSLSYCSVNTESNQSAGWRLQNAFVLSTLQSGITH